jgi:rhodanese-related sulfurtransferase
MAGGYPPVPFQIYKKGSTITTHQRIILILLLFAGFTLGVCLDPTPKYLCAEEAGGIREAVETWLKTERKITISAPELFNLLTDEKPANDPFVIDLRQLDSPLPNVYTKAHLPGALNIPWRSILKKEVLDTLPRDRQIVVYCYNGHIGCQIATLLSLLGHNVSNLEWGFTSWVCDPLTAPGQYVEKEDCRPFPVEAIKRETEPNQAPPLMKKSESSIRDMIRSLGDIWVSSNKTGEISNEELYNQLMDTDIRSEPFVVDVRRPDDYNRGHIRGAVNIFWKDVAKYENLRRLPADRKIIVCGHTGGDEAASITAILNLLGYDAVNLRWGMTSWTYNKKIAPVRYEKTTDCLDLPFVRGFSPSSTLSVY